MTARWTPFYQYPICNETDNTKRITRKGPMEAYWTRLHYRIYKICPLATAFLRPSFISGVLCARSSDTCRIVTCFTDSTCRMSLAESICQTATVF